MNTDDRPPTQKGRHYEIRAAGLREFAGLRRPEQPLDPFRLAKYANLFIPSFEELSELLSKETVEQLLVKGKNDWSGGAASIPLPDGRKLIILNPTHGRNRQRATLMEEISHVFLGHKPSRLAITKRNKEGKIIARDYNADIEEEAYGTGAAALIPYLGLRRYVEDGKTSAEIARHFGVSRALVEFRIKVSKLWDTYKKNLAERES